MRHKVLSPSKERKREKNQNHQSLILFPSSWRGYSRRGGTLTYTPPLSPSWGPPTTPEIELPQGATWRLNALLQQAPQGPVVHLSLSGNPCHCNLQPITFPRDSLICVHPEWTLCGCVVKFTLRGLVQHRLLDFFSAKSTKCDILQNATALQRNERHLRLYQNAVAC